MAPHFLPVKRATWVRIVNPQPHTPADRTYRYGENLLVRRGGIIVVLITRPGHCLAMYQAPHPPISDDDCPTGAMLFHTFRHLRRIAEGLENYYEPYDLPIRGGVTCITVGAPPEAGLKVGRIGRVPLSRCVRAMPRPVERESTVGSPFRNERTVTVEQAASANGYLRPGGFLTVTEARGHDVRVRYVPNPDRADEQCEEGSWFWMPAADFIAMDQRYSEISMFQLLERFVIERLLRTL